MELTHKEFLLSWKEADSDLATTRTPLRARDAEI